VDNRPLIDYLPQVLKEVREYKAIMATEEPELRTLWTALEDALKDNFVSEATEHGVLRLESILKITPKVADTLTDRRFRIKARFNEQLPYTFRTLEERLRTLCGEDGYTCELLSDSHMLSVRVEVVAKGQYSAVEELLHRLAPANLIIDLELRYNQNATLKNFTHAQLSAYTHKHLKEEVII